MGRWNCRRAEEVPGISGIFVLEAGELHGVLAEGGHGVARSLAEARRKARDEKRGLERGIRLSVRTHGVRREAPPIWRGRLREPST